MFELVSDISQMVSRATPHRLSISSSLRQANVTSILS